MSAQVPAGSSGYVVTITVGDELSGEIAAAVAAEVTEKQGAPPAGTGGAPPVAAPSGTGGGPPAA
jgi:hypothetical protein